MLREFERFKGAVAESVRERVAGVLGMHLGLGALPEAESCQRNEQGDIGIVGKTMDLNSVQTDFPLSGRSVIGGGLRLSGVLDDLLCSGISCIGEHDWLRVESSPCLHLRPLRGSRALVLLDSVVA